MNSIPVGPEIRTIVRQIQDLFGVGSAPPRDLELYADNQSTQFEPQPNRSDSAARDVSHRTSFGDRGAFDKMCFPIFSLTYLKVLALWLRDPKQDLLARKKDLTDQRAPPRSAQP